MGLVPPAADNARERACGPDNQYVPRQVNVMANDIVAKLADEKNVFYLDIGPSFLAADGTLDRHVMPDLLHPNGPMSSVPS